MNNKIMRQGFFEVKEIVYIKRGKSKSNVLTCESCGAYKNCISPKMKPTGENKKNILILGERPGKKENEQNTQFIGDAGQFLREPIKELGYDLDIDFVKDNAVICWAYDKKKRGNKTPTIKEINCCRNHVFETIEKYNPKVIIPLGKIALQSLIGHRIKGNLSEVKYSDWVGEIIPDQELKKYICSTYHPSFVMRKDKDIVLKRNWEKDLKKAIEMSDKPFYIHNYEKDILIIKKAEEAIKIINDFMKKNSKKRIFSFDYETTGRKPHRQGHKIYTASFSDGLYGYSFPFFEDDEFRLTWKKLLTDEESYCIAQNAYFEQMWTEIILGYKIKNWYWDTMIAQSIIDNRKNTKLKFHVYTKFGILNYDEKVEKYIKEIKEGENKKSANSFNRIEEADIDDVLLYNGQDSLFTYKLYENQVNQIDGHLRNGFDLFKEGFQRLLKAQQNGIRINEEEIVIAKKKLIRKKKIIEESIYKYKELEKWDKKDKKFDFTKTNDLKHLLYNCLKCKIKKTTKKTNSPSLDQSALEKIDLPLVKDILEWRRWDKVLTTYVLQYYREIVDGYIHPFFNLGVKIKTYRSSSSAPNVQNLIKRDEQAKKILRSLIIPRKGNRLIEYDFKSMEVCVAGANNEDPVLIEYLKDDSTDMHRDWSALLFAKDKSNIDKKERFTGKNQFVFASFYGSYYVDTAKGLWENMPDYTKKHLRNEGIVKYKDWEEHVRQVEEKLWDTFHVYAEWKRRTYKDYEKKGYIELFTGFRCYGSMKYNEVINYKIQGPAFHILLYTFNNVMRIMEKRKYNKSFLIGQIHDSMLGDIHPDDEEEIDYLIWKWGTQKVREYWPWIIVPLKIEKESSEINGSWANMTGKGFLKEK